MYRLIGSPKSRAFRVLWMLEELGVDYEIDPASPRSDEVRAVNPSGKVPVLTDGEAVIIDSTAICQYLADKHGKLTYPVGTLERAQQDSWLHLILDEVDATLWFHARNSFILPEELRSETAKDACKHEFDRAMTHIEQRLGGKAYAMGDDFTLPDLLFGHCAGWAANGPGWAMPAGTVADYAERVRARPACQRSLEIRESF